MSDITTCTRSLFLYNAPINVCANFQDYESTIESPNFETIPIIHLHSRKQFKVSRVVSFDSNVVFNNDPCNLKSESSTETSHCRT